MAGRCSSNRKRTAPDSTVTPHAGTCTTNITCKLTPISDDSGHSMYTLYNNSSCLHRRRSSPNISKSTGQKSSHATDFGQHFPQTTPLSSHVTLHLTSRQHAEIIASTRCRDAWLCKGTAAEAYNFDSHASNQPVDVLEHIHLDRRDPLRLRARNFTSPLLAARRRFFQYKNCSLGGSGMSPCALGMLLCSSYDGISI